MPPMPPPRGCRVSQTPFIKSNSHCSETGQPMLGYQGAVLHPGKGSMLESLMEDREMERGVEEKDKTKV